MYSVHFTLFVELVGWAWGNPLFIMTTSQDVHVWGILTHCTYAQQGHVFVCISLYHFKPLAVWDLIPVENLASGNLLLGQSRIVKYMWPYHSCCLILVWDNTGSTYCTRSHQFTFQHRCSAELTAVPVCYLLDCIIMLLTLLAIVYQVNAVIMPWRLVPTIQCFH